MSSRVPAHDRGGATDVGLTTLFLETNRCRSPGYILTYVPDSLPPRYLLVLRAYVGMYVKVVSYHTFWPPFQGALGPPFREGPTESYLFIGVEWCMGENLGSLAPAESPNHSCWCHLPKQALAGATVGPRSCATLILLNYRETRKAAARIAVNGKSIAVRDAHANGQKRHKIPGRSFIMAFKMDALPKACDLVATGIEPCAQILRPLQLTPVPSRH